MNQGMRHAWRSLARTPAFTALAVLTLAIGIGTNTTIFAIVDELAFKPVRNTAYENVFNLGSIQIPDYDTLVAHRPEGVSAIAAFDSEGGGLLQVPGRAERVVGWRVSAGYADVHRVRAQVGRWINDEDNVGGALDPTMTFRGVVRPFVLGQLGAPVVVISDRVWREWFNASPAITERGAVNINHKPMQIVGVAPAGFETAIDVWVPFGRRRLLTREELDLAAVRRSPFDRGPVQRPTQPRVRVLLRKDPGASDSTVNARLTAALAARPATPEMPAARIRIDPRRGDDRLVRTGYVILGFAALIFVAACANLGNMLYARATEREGELAVRLSIGATGFAIFGLLVSETIVICAAASAAGLLFSTAALRLFTNAFPAFQVSYWQRVTFDLSLDWRSFGYTTGAGAAAALIVGAGSLWRSNRVSLLARIAASGPAVVAKTEGRTLRTMLVAVQIAAAVLLLIATGMLLENTSKELNRRLYFDTGALVAARLELPDKYDESRGPYFFGQLLSRVRKIEGVSAASLADALPGGEAPSPRHGVSAIIAEAPPRGLSGTPRRLDGQWIHVSPGFVDTLGLAVLKGRDLRDSDRAGSPPVVLVTESTARQLWQDDEPVGKRIACCGATYLREVVGVVPDPVGALDKPKSMDLGEAIRELSSGSGPGVFVFVPATQRYSREMLLVVRTDTPRAVVQPLRDAVAALDPAVPVFGVGPVGVTQFSRAAADQSVRVLAGALGAIALGIAVLGVYAVVSYFVSRRTREFGLRLALGSTRAQVVKLVVDHAIHMVLIGLLPGVLLASWGTRYFQVELVKLRPNGLTVWIAIPILMLVAGIVAAWIPARRAAKVDPYQALKEL